jgi:hypothetical protein
MTSRAAAHRKREAISRNCVRQTEWVKNRPVNNRFVRCLGLDCQAQWACSTNSISRAPGMASRRSLDVAEFKAVLKLPSSSAWMDYERI